MDSWGGISQTAILLHKPYLVYVTPKGKGKGKKYPKNWPRGLRMIPIDIIILII